MGTIEELKTTLAAHADLPDEGLPGRAEAVAGRVKAVRRRRQAAVAAAAFAVVAGAAGVTLLPAQHDTPRVAATVVGVDVPEHLTSLGRTYRYDHKVVAESGKATVQLEASDQPRLVSWATKGSDQAVRVTVPNSDEGDGFVSRRPDFTDFTVVPEGVDWKVSLEGPGDPLGIAVYDLEKEAPGVTRDGVTFRQQVADRQLVTAKVGEKGKPELSLTFTAGQGTYYLADWCTSSWNGHGRIRAWMNLAFEDQGSTGRSCDAASRPVDAGADASTSPDGDLGLPMDGVKPGDKVTLTLRMTTDEKGRTLLDDPEAQLGIGVYVGGPGRASRAGAVPETVEHDGHTWQLKSVEEGSIGPGAALSAPMPGGRERFLVGFHVDDTEGAPIVQLRTDTGAGSMVEYSDGTEGGSALGGYGTPGSGWAKLTARGGRADAAITVYELVE